MNVAEGLQRIRERLVENGADPKTVALVDGIARRASVPSAQAATAKSLMELARMLQRTPVANNDITVYNDLLRLEEQLEQSAAAYRDRVESEERQSQAFAEHRSKAYYKQQKDRKKAGG